MLLSSWRFAEITPDDSACAQDNPHQQVVDGQTFSDALAGRFPAIGYFPFDEGAGSDAFSAKGIGFARLERPDGGLVDVFFTHLQATYEDQDYEDWKEDSIDIRRDQLAEAANYMACIRANSPADLQVFAGDLNIMGDLSNPFVDPSDSSVLGTDCSLQSGPCSSQALGPDDRCRELGGNTVEVCRDHKLQEHKRLDNRAEWDFFFNTQPGSEPFPSHPMRGLFKDAWAEFMTPEHMPGFGDPPVSPPFEPSLTFTPNNESSVLLGLQGEADFDRGFTTHDLDSESRLDYIMLHNEPSSPNICAQHVTRAYNLLAGDGQEGGISPPPGEERLAGQHTLTDHYGVNAEIDLEGPHCSPGSAFVAPPLNFGIQGELRLKLPYRGAVHWIRIDQPGTYSFSVNPKHQLIPWFSGTFNNGLDYRVYERTDLSRPLAPHEGEVVEVPPFDLCTEGFCREIAGFKEAKFHTLRPPFFVKVFHPDDDYPAWWHGEYTFLYKRAQCSSLEEACVVGPYEGTRLVDPTDPAGDIEVVPAAAQSFPATAGDPRWYSLHIDAPDGAMPQNIRIFVTEDNTGATPLLGSIQLRDTDGTTPVTLPSGTVLEATSPTRDAQNRFVWEITDNSGFLDLDNNPGSRSKKYFVKINRAAMTTTPNVDFWVSWETDLTWLYGPTLGGDPARVICYDNTDDFSDDEVYMQVVADAERYPIGARSGEALDGPDLDKSFDENADEREWTDRIIPRLGNNSHGVDYAGQRAIKFVDHVQLQLIEEDSGLTFGDDYSHITVDPLGRVFGDREVPARNWPGAGDYRHRGGSLSHARPQKPCSGSADCDAPLQCRGGLCLQEATP